MASMGRSWKNLRQARRGRGERTEEQQKWWTKKKRGKEGSRRDEVPRAIKME
jgi:hypothetical protein